MSRKRETMMKKKPSARIKRGSLKKLKPRVDFFPDFDFFSLSGFLKLLVLKEFSAIREFAGKNKQYISENGSSPDELLPNGISKNHTGTSTVNTEPWP